MDCLVAEGHQRPAYIIRRFAHAALTFGWPLSIAAVRLVRDGHPARDQAVSEISGRLRSQYRAPSARLRRTASSRYHRRETNGRRRHDTRRRNTRRCGWVHTSLIRRYSSSLDHLRSRSASIAWRPLMNSVRFRQQLSGVYASPILTGSRLFQASSGNLTFCAAMVVERRKRWAAHVHTLIVRSLVEGWVSAAVRWSATVAVVVLLELPRYLP